MAQSDLLPHGEIDSDRDTRSGHTGIATTRSVLDLALPRETDTRPEIQYRHNQTILSGYGALRAAGRMSTSKRQLGALTGIRFFLALWIVVYHQGESFVGSIGGPPEFHREIECLVWTGYTAVSAFFILSGFVLAYNYDLGTLINARNATRFGIARFSRIYPAYTTGLLLLIPFAVYRVVAGVDGGPSAGAMNFILNAYLLQAWFPGAALTWNFSGWSISLDGRYRTKPFSMPRFPWWGSRSYGSPGDRQGAPYRVFSGWRPRFGCCLGDAGLCHRASHFTLWG